jgi:hypothetical protein
MKVNYPTNNKNTQMDFSDNFHNIKNSVQADHIEKIMKIRLNFSFCRSKKKTPAIGKKFNHQKLTQISVKLLCKNFRKIGPPRASEYKFKPDRQNLWNRQ